MEIKLMIQNSDLVEVGEGYVLFFASHLNWTNDYMLEIVTPSDWNRVVEYHLTGNKLTEFQDSSSLFSEIQMNK